MDAIEFIKERNRMCDYYKDNRCWNDNEQCPALYCKCHDFRNAADDGFKIVDIVDQWSKKHPQKTMLQDLLGKFPNTILEETTKVPIFCPIHLGYEKSTSNVCGKYTCFECWNRPLED